MPRWKTCDDEAANVKSPGPEAHEVVTALRYDPSPSRCTRTAARLRAATWLPSPAYRATKRASTHALAFPTGSCVA